MFSEVKMRQAIITKYIAPTNTKGTRISVKASAGRKFYDWDHNRDTDNNHEHAARLFAGSLGWTQYFDLVGGSLPDNSGYCFVAVPKVKKS